MDAYVDEPRFPSAEEYAGQTARHAALQVVDIARRPAAVDPAYSNQVLLDVNGECLRLAVFEGLYRWHHHPDSDELFLVVHGALEIEFRDRAPARLGPWQCILVPAGVSHRTRAIGPTANLTFERQGACTVFEDEEDT